MPQPESCLELRDMRHTPLAKQGRSPTLQPTNSVLLPMRSRQRGRRLPKASVTKLVAGSASGSAPSFPARSANSSSTTSGFATSCAGSPSFADWVARKPPPPPA